MVHVLRCISYAPLNLNITLPSRPPNTVIFKAILGRCVIICDIAWHVPEDCLSLHYLCSLPLSPALFLFCLSLIKKPNHADSSEQITSHSPWMFEDDGATGATREGIHSDRSRSSSWHDISTHKFAPVLFSDILILLFLLSSTDMDVFAFVLLPLIWAVF